MPFADLGSSFTFFFNSAAEFFRHLSEIRWTPFLAALVKGQPPPWLTLAAGNGCGTVYQRQR